MTNLGRGQSLCCKQFLCPLHVSIQCLTCSKTSSDESLGLGRLVSMATTGLLGSYVYQAMLYPYLEFPTNNLHSSEGSEFTAVIRSHCIRTLNFVVRSASGFLRSYISRCQSSNDDTQTRHVIRFTSMSIYDRKASTNGMFSNFQCSKLQHLF